MATKDEPSLADRVYGLMEGLVSVDAGPVRPDTELAAIGFDSLAAAELASGIERELGVDIVEARLGKPRTAGELAGVVATAATGRAVKRDRYPRGMGRIQGFCRIVAGAFCRWWFRLEVTGVQHLPRSGPVVVCMNHESFLDIPLISVASPRRVRIMAKRELFEKPSVARFLHELGGFPVERDAFDLRPIEIALEVLARGQVLGMYPEGTRTPGVLLPFLPGAAWLALKTGAPLLPVAMEGTHEAMPKGARFFKRVPIRISFAAPIPVDRVDDVVERRKQAIDLTRQLRDSIEGMLVR